MKAEGFIGKKLLLLGGVRPMIEVVNRAHEYGIQVYVTDYLENSPCKKYADKSFMVNALDVDAVVELIKKEQIDGVITGYVDMLLPYYAEICEKADLPSYGTKEQFELITDKKRFKDKCVQCGVPVPREYSKEDIANKRVEFPVIVKPVDSSGSRGVSVCYNYQELLIALEFAKKNSKKGSYIVEDYMTDGIVLMHYYVQDCNPIFIGMGDRYTCTVYEGKAPYNCCKLFPSKYTSNHLKETDKRIKNMLREIGIENGLIEIEAFIKNGVPYAGDIGYRLCGSRLQYIFNKVFGVFSPDLLIEFALTGRMADYKIEDRVDPYLNGKYACTVDISIRPGKIQRILGVEELKKKPYIAGVCVTIDEGEELPENCKGLLRSLTCRTFAVTDDETELARIMNEIYDTIDFLDENDNSLKLPTNRYNACIKDHLSA